MINLKDGSAIAKHEACVAEALVKASPSYLGVLKEIKSLQLDKKIEGIN